MICPYCLKEFNENLYRCQKSKNLAGGHIFIYNDPTNWFLSVYPNKFDIYEIGNEDPRTNGLNYEYFIYIQKDALKGISYSLPPFELCDIMIVLNRFLKLKSFV
jgi:hypothetical protein